jgi:uncharacterized membrane protein YbhN (UPF0104 family)
MPEEAESSRPLPGPAQDKLSQWDDIPIVKRTADIAKYTLLVVVALFTLFILRKKFKALGITWEGVSEAIGNVSPWSILLAVGITLANFALLTGYDLIAVRYLRKQLPMRQVMMGAIIGYALSNVLGWLIGGNAVRYRLYSRWGFSLVEFIAFISILSVTFWLGLFLLAGVAFVALPINLPPRFEEELPVSPQSLGWILLMLVAAYLLATALVRKPIRWKGNQLYLPPFRLSLMQLLVSAGDFALASSVLYVLLPSGVRGLEEVNFWTILVAYLAAMIVVVSVHIPGGIGILEVIVLYMMPDSAGLQVTAALILFRIIYYFIPAIIAMLMFLAIEFSSGGRGDKASMNAPARH